MIKIFIISLLSFIFFTSCHDITNQVKDKTQKQSFYTLTKNDQIVLNKCIHTYLKAYKKKDYEYMIEQLYPPLFHEFEIQNPEYTREELIRELASQMHQDISRMEAKGMSMDSLDFDANNSTVVNFNDTLYTTFQYNASIKYKNRIINQNKTTIAISENKGITWFFADDTDQTRELLKNKLSESAYDFLH